MSSPDFTVSSDRTSLTRVAGVLGMTACCIGLAIFLAACFGIENGLALALAPLGLAGVGMTLSLAGAIWRRGSVENTPVLAAIGLNFMGLAGGLLLLAAWKNWPLFARP